MGSHFSKWFDDKPEIKRFILECVTPKDFREGEYMLIVVNKADNIEATPGPFLEVTTTLADALTQEQHAELLMKGCDPNDYGVTILHESRTGLSIT